MLLLGSFSIRFPPGEAAFYVISFSFFSVALERAGSRDSMGFAIFGGTNGGCAICLLAEISRERRAFGKEMCPLFFHLKIPGLFRPQRNIQRQMSHVHSSI